MIHALPCAFHVLSSQAPPKSAVIRGALECPKKSGYLTNALLHNLSANQTLHKFNLILTVKIIETPKADPEERLAHVECGDGFHRIEMRFGFSEETDIPTTLRQATIPGLDFDKIRTVYFISHGQVVATKFAGMPIWRARLFAFMMRNASSATSRFHLPENGLIEIGSRIDV